jgi:hypothetical protein
LIGLQKDFGHEQGLSLHFLQRNNGIMQETLTPRTIPAMHFFLLGSFLLQLKHAILHTLALARKSNVASHHRFFRISYTVQQAHKGKTEEKRCRLLRR